MTKDLDVWVMAAPENAERLLEALEDFGFGDLDLTVDDFRREGTMVQLGYPANRIHLLVGIDGVDFAECWDRRLVVSLDGVELPFIGLEDLVANKRATGRPQDLADIDHLGQDPG